MKKLAEWLNTFTEWVGTAFYRHTLITWIIGMIVIAPFVIIQLNNSHLSIWEYALFLAILTMLFGWLLNLLVMWSLLILHLTARILNNFSRKNKMENSVARWLKDNNANIIVWVIIIGLLVVGFIRTPEYTKRMLFMGIIVAALYWRDKYFKMKFHYEDAEEKIRELRESIKRIDEERAKLQEELWEKQ